MEIKMENSQFKDQHIDIKKIEDNPQESIAKSKEAVATIMTASELLEEAGIITISRDLLFLAKSVALFVNDLERDINKPQDNVVKISDKVYTEMLNAIKNIKIED